MQITTRLEERGESLASSGADDMAMVRFLPEGPLGSPIGSILSPEIAIIAIGAGAASRLHDYLSTALLQLEAAVAERGEPLVVDTPLPFPQGAAAPGPAIVEPECRCADKANHAPWCHLMRTAVGIAMAEDEPR